jgi:hypothetical protein
MNERMSGGSGGREEEMNGQRANEVRVCGKGTWRELPSGHRDAKQGRTSAGERKVKERERTERRKGSGGGKREVGCGERERERGETKKRSKGKSKGRRDVQRWVGSLRFAGIDCEKRAERRRGRKTRGYNSTGPLFILSARPSWEWRANLQGPNKALIRVNLRLNRHLTHREQALGWLAAVIGVWWTHTPDPRRERLFFLVLGDAMRRVPLD